MRIIPFGQLFSRFEKRVTKCDLRLDIYKGRWQCACGQTHYGFHDMDVICQGFFKILIHCPDDPYYITAVNIKTGFFGMGFKGLESEMGTKMESDYDKDLAKSIFQAVYAKKLGIDVLPFMHWFNRRYFDWADARLSKQFGRFAE